jgi:Matrixin
MRRVFRPLLLSIAVFAGHYDDALAQTAPTHRTVHASGLKQTGAYGVRIDITLDIPPDADADAIVADALARRGAQPVANSDPTLQSVLPTLHWPQFFDHTVKNPFVPQYYNPAGDTVPGGALEALQADEAEWSAVPTSKYAVHYAGMTTRGEAFDGFNTVSWPASWPDSPNALDVTITTFFVQTGVIVDADIIINGQYFQYFTNPVDLTPTSFDLRYVLLHENGHVAGLGHSLDPSAVMFPVFSSGIVGHGLAQDDIFAISWLYPTHPQPPILRVPEDFSTIQLAVNHANAGDAIRVGPGRWCGARITKTLYLIGESATIIGCPAGVPGPVGRIFRRGFVVDAPGTSISGFVFDGNGFSDTNQAPLAIGIEIAQFQPVDNVVIDSNTFQGASVGIESFGGNNHRVAFNVFDGFTILSNGAGGVAILELGAFAQDRGNSIQYNTITSTVPAGDFAFASWTNEVDVPFAGIVVSGETGTQISNNKVSITTNSNGDAGVGIIATDGVTGATTTNLTITNNDGTGSAYDLIVTNDLSGGTGNSVGAQIRGNFGVNLINNVTTNVRTRSRQTSLLCDPVTGSCP